MAIIKSYTDLEQSKKLAEILPLESADMHYGNFSPKGLGYEYKFSAGLTSYVKEIKVYEELKESYKIKDYNGIVAWRVIPCWSLAALLGVLPQSITKYIDNERCQKTFHLNLFRSYYYCVSYSFTPSISDDDGNNTLYCIGRENWVDACVTMIEKLHELNLL